MFKILRRWRFCSNGFINPCVRMLSVLLTTKICRKISCRMSFFELWQRRESIRFEDAAVKSYLFRAVYTHALNALNKKQQDVYTLEPAREADILDQYVTSYMQNSEQSLLLKELEEEILSYINTLPPQCHKIFMLSRSYGLKNREIAEQLDISVKAVEKQISKALAGLKEHLVQKDLYPLLAVACLSR